MCSCSWVAAASTRSVAACARDRVSVPMAAPAAVTASTPNSCHSDRSLS